MRRRNGKSISKYDITQDFPFFFWKKCDKCGDEIKREIMWRIDMLSDCVVTTPNGITYRYDGHSMGTYNLHFCTECYNDSDLGRQRLKEYCEENIK